jgi:hypothetical protein
LAGGLFEHLHYFVDQFPLDQFGRAREERGEPFRR